MPWFLIPFFAILFAFITVIVRMSYKHEMAKLQQEKGRSPEADRSLTTTELEVMIEDAVAAAMVGVRKELDDFSSRLDAVGAGKPQGLLDEPDERPADRTVGRTARTRS